MEFDIKAEKTNNYKMSFTVGGLFWQESIIAVELYIQKKDWNVVQKEILKSNLFQVRTVASLKRITREILSRLQTLSSEQIEIIHHGSMQEQIQMLWIAVCKNYNFIHDFAVEVIRDKFLLMDYTLTKQDYNIFFNTKAEWNKELEILKDSTKNKLQQVLFKILREVEIISNDQMITPAIVSKRIARMLLNDKSGVNIVLPVSDMYLKEMAE